MQCKVANAIFKASNALSLERGGDGVESKHCEFISHEASRVRRERPEQDRNASLVKRNWTFVLQKLFQHVNRARVRPLGCRLQSWLDDVHGNGYQPVANPRHASRKQGRPDRKLGPDKIQKYFLARFSKIRLVMTHIPLSLVCTKSFFLLGYSRHCTKSKLHKKIVSVWGSAWHVWIRVVCKSYFWTSQMSPMSQTHQLQRHKRGKVQKNRALSAFICIFSLQLPKYFVAFKVFTN